jgi:hypothetical protein
MSKGFGKVEIFVLTIFGDRTDGLTVRALTRAWLHRPVTQSARDRARQEAIRCAVKSLTRKRYVRVVGKEVFSDRS